MSFQIPRETPISKFLALQHDGDKQALNQLCAAYLGPTVRLIRRQLFIYSLRHVDADPDDLANAVFIKFVNALKTEKCRDLPSRRETSKLLKTLIRNETVNLIRNLCRQKHGGGRHPLSLEPEDCSCCRLPEFESDLQVQDLLAQLRKADPKYQLIAQLALEGYSRAEISERLGCKNATTARRLREVRNILKAAGLGFDHDADADADGDDNDDDDGNDHQRKRRSSI